MANFFFLLDTIHCNALTMYAIKHGKPLGEISAFDIGWDLVMSLVKPFIETRLTVTLGIGLHCKISVILGRNVDEFMNISGLVKKKSNGVIFVYSIFLDKIKKKKDALKYLKSGYQKCDKTVSDDHSFV